MYSSYNILAIKECEIYEDRSNWCGVVGERKSEKLIIKVLQCGKEGEYKYLDFKAPIGVWEHAHLLYNTNI